LYSRQDEKKRSWTSSFVSFHKLEASNPILLEGDLELEMKNGSEAAGFR
jgi:hypothetical protein